MQYSFQAGSSATLTPRLNYAYVGPQFTGLFHSPTLDLLAPRGLVSALPTYHYHDWQLEAFVNNLADKRHVAGQNGNNGSYGSPREYGIRASVNFWRFDRGRVSARPRIELAA